MSMGDESKNGYWVVRLEAYAFESKDDAGEFSHALIDAFCAIPEAKNYGCATKVVFEEDEQ